MLRAIPYSCENQVSLSLRDLWVKNLKGATDKYSQWLFEMEWFCTFNKGKDDHRKASESDIIFPRIAITFPVRCFTIHRANSLDGIPTVTLAAIWIADPFYGCFLHSIRFPL